MRSIGVIDEERLQLIDSKHWPAHEFCFFLHDRLLQLLIEYEGSGAHNMVPEAFREAAKGHEDKLGSIDIIEFMKSKDLTEPYSHFIISHVVLALTADMLHFLYESLKCFEKAKYSVAYAMLRKPLKEHLFFLSWIVADESDFLPRFEADNYRTKGVRPLYSLRLDGEDGI